MPTRWPRTSPSASKPRCRTPATSRSWSSARRARSRWQSNTMNVLMVGDIFGEPGRAALARLLPRLREEHVIDFCVVNCENAAGGFGITGPMARQMLDHGADVLTSGNHIWDKKEII